MSKLWRDNPATRSQQSLVFRKPRRSSGRVTQAAILVTMLRAARAAGQALELPQILELGIAQFTARIFELRERGFVIDNEMQRSDGRTLSRYWLRHDPEQGGEL